jgi:hypothetical protein
MRLRYEAFWPGFNPNDFFITKYFNTYNMVNDSSYDILICSVFPRNTITNLNKKGKIIIFNGEHPSYIINFIKNTGIKPDIFIGFTDIDVGTDLCFLKEIYHNKLPLLLYYPLWILYYDKMFSQEYFDMKNKELELITFEEFNNKKFCCLINSHDNNNSRTPIYNYLKEKSKQVDCPGRLLNNINQQLVGTSSEDKIKFMKEYKFNICSENKYGYGYLTEKLPQAMDSLSIPIYVGSDDSTKINFKIFNKDRVIFIKNNNFEELDKIINDDKKMYEIYKKPIFIKDSYKILENYMKLIKTILLYNL